MYSSIYVSGLYVVVDPPPDGEPGVYIDGPGPLDFVCYAFRQLNAGRSQALVTPEQLAQIDLDGIPYQTFVNLPADEKDADGSPSHVFGPWEIAKDGDGYKRWWPDSGTPEDL